jgi:hypothetical protein
MASTDRAVAVQRALLVVVAAVLLTLAVVAGLWFGDRRREADQSSFRVVSTGYVGSAVMSSNAAAPGPQASRKV